MEGQSPHAAFGSLPAVRSALVRIEVWTRLKLNLLVTNHVRFQHWLSGCHAWIWL